MFKAIRIGILLFVLFFVSVGAWLSTARSTDWNNSLWIKLYPINGDGSEAADRYIDRLDVDDFNAIEQFIAREAERYGKSVQRPVRVELGRRVHEQPPALDASRNVFGVMLWSLKMRWWASRVGGEQDSITPDVRIFVRYHEPSGALRLEDSVGLQKGMVGIVNGYTGRNNRGYNNVIIAHEFLHTLGATDKYDPATGQPLPPDGLAAPGAEPLYPQQQAEIMGGRIALSAHDAIVPSGLRHAVIGAKTAEEIRLSN